MLSEEKEMPLSHLYETIQEPEYIDSPQKEVSPANPLTYQRKILRIY